MRAKRTQCDAVLCQTFVHFLKRQLVAGSDVEFGLIDGLVFNFDAGFPCLLQLRFLVDELLYGQAGELTRFEVVASAGRFLGQALAQNLHFLVGDGLGVHHRHNEIGLSNGCSRGLRQGP